MVAPEKIFENFFDDVKIINNRLGVFTGDTIGKLITQNTGGRFDGLITLLNGSYPAFTGNISNLDVAITLQKGGTMTVDGLVTLFAKTMSEQEPFISRALGGRDTDAYLQFYTHKISEYTTATQAEMITLTTRVNTAATTNATALGTTLTTLLQGFKAAWTTAKVLQNTKKGTVTSTRGDRNSTRTTLELNLCTVVHSIAALFPGDIAGCMGFFNFPLLYNSVRHKNILKSGTIVANKTVMIFDELFPADHIIKTRNTTDNAIIKAYFAVSPDAEPVDGVGIFINPNKDKSKPASDYGDVRLPYFVIKDLSLVNDATYIVETKALL